MIHKGDLFVTPADPTDYRLVERVEGSVCLYPNATLYAPTLVNIGSDLRLQAGAYFNAPALIAVVDCLTVHPGAILSVPRLRDVGDLSVLEGAVINAPSLSTINGWLVVSSNARADLPSIQSVVNWALRSKGVVLGLDKQSIRTTTELTRQKHRYRAHLSTAPHARCERAGRCVEHDANPQVKPCVQE